jgi:hypothetical protein
MALTSTKIDAHWNYFLSVEQDLERLSRFVEFDERNYECFSVEIARLLITAAAEVDVVCKQVCRKLNISSNADNIHEYREQIVPAYPVVHRFEVLAPRYGLQLKPWATGIERTVFPFGGRRITKSSTTGIPSITAQTSKTS